MNKTIWKFTLTGSSTVEMPKGAEILCVQSQNNSPFVWALVDPSQTVIEKRIFEIYGTGHIVLCNAGIERRYIGTFQIDNGSFVFHVFERIN